MFMLQTRSSADSHNRLLSLQSTCALAFFFACRLGSRVFCEAWMPVTVTSSMTRTASPLVTRKEKRFFCPLFGKDPFSEEEEHLSSSEDKQRHSSPHLNRKESSDDNNDTDDESTRVSNNIARRNHNSNNHTLQLNDNSSNTTATVLKKIRVSKAQAEIDQLLAGPDAPLDMERELQRVVQMAPPVPDSTPSSTAGTGTTPTTTTPTTTTSTTTTTFSDAELLEHDLYAAVKRHDYAQAAAVKRQLDQAHVDDCGAVLQANAAFYRAFSQRNYAAMCDVWCTADNTISCIHPASRQALTGTKAVMASWKALLEDRPTGTAFSSIRMEPHKVRLSVKAPNMAIVSCEERVFCRRFVRGRPKETRLVNKCMATNVFRRVVTSDSCNNDAGGQTRWKLIHHHATWHMDSPAGKAAWRTLGTSNNDNNDDDQESTMQGIVGLNQLRADLGNAGKKKSQSQQPSQQRPNVIRLSDILGDKNGFGEMFKNDNAGNNNPNELLGGIINIRRVSSEDEAGQMNEDLESLLSDFDDDDDDDDEDDESDGPTSHRSLQPTSKNNKNHGRNSSSQMRKTVEDESADHRHQKDVLRQSCITMLRKLTEQGILSPRQKRTLLTDIIYCSANGEFSMVEVAYELLYAENDVDQDNDLAAEEFAEQCHAFAASLERSSVHGGHPATD